MIFEATMPRLGRSGDLEHRRDAIGRHRLAPRPALRPQLFQRAEARLVRHAGRSFDPIAQIDIGQPRLGRAADMVGDDEGAQPIGTASLHSVTGTLAVTQVLKRSEPSA